MRKILVLVLALILALPMVANSESAIATLQEMYAQAELLMAQGDYTGAAAKFEVLGTYSDASQMTMYCKAIAAVETLGLYAMAVDAFNELGDFKDSKQMAKYYEGRAYEVSGNIDLTTASDAALEQSIWAYEEAEKAYIEIAFFKDSLTRMAICGEKIEEIKSEQSRRVEAREEAKKEATYKEALTLEQNGNYAEAISLYQIIKGYQDSTERISICQTAIDEAIYQKALWLEQNGDYIGAIDLYQTIISYKDSLIRMENCTAQKAEQDYQKAISFVKEEKYLEALKLFVGLGDYKDAKAKAKDANYHYACALFASEQYDEAKAIFTTMPTYKGSANYIIECDYQQACLLQKNANYDDAVLIFEAIIDHRDSAHRLSECRYNIALKHMNAGEYEAAISIFEAEAHYSDASAMATESKYLLAKQLLVDSNNYESSKLLFEEVKEYKDSATYLQLLSETKSMVFQCNDGFQYWYLWVHSIVDVNSCSLKMLAQEARSNDLVSTEYLDRGKQKYSIDYLWKFEEWKYEKGKLLMIFEGTDPTAEQSHSYREWTITSNWRSISSQSMTGFGERLGDPKKYVRITDDEEIKIIIKSFQKYNAH